MTIKRWKPLLATAGILAAATLTACGGKEPDPGASAPAATPVLVDLAVAAAEPVAGVVEASGGVKPWQRVSPGSKILGRVEAVPVREGDRVERGQLLARLESRDLEATVRRAEAAVAMAEAELENASIQEQRFRALHARGSVTDKNLEDVTAALRVASAGRQQAQAELATAKVALSYARVESPIRGWVVERRVEAGDMAAPGEPLLTVEDLSRVKVEVEVPESQVAGLAAGDSALVILEVLGEERAARVERVMPAGDPASRTFRVQLILDNPDGRIRSGMFARARLPRAGGPAGGLEAAGREALRVPRTAIVERGQLRGLFTVDSESRARLRWVKLGRTEGGWVEVLSGLAAGDRYLTAPPADLADGAAVRAAAAAGGGAR